MNQKRSIGLTIKEHKELSVRLKSLPDDLGDIATLVAQKYPSNHPIVRTALQAYKVLSNLRSVLDSDVCMLQVRDTPDVTKYYYGNN